MLILFKLLWESKSLYIVVLCKIFVHKYYIILRFNDIETGNLITWNDNEPFNLTDSNNSFRNLV